MLGWPGSDQREDHIINSQVDPVGDSSKSKGSGKMNEEISSDSESER